MLRSMITATNTMNQLQQQLDAIGHNLANIDTNGYKKNEHNLSRIDETRAEQSAGSSKRNRQID